MLQLELGLPKFEVLAVFDLAGVNLSENVFINTRCLPLDCPLRSTVEPHDAGADRDLVA